MKYVLVIIIWLYCCCKPGSSSRQHQNIGRFVCYVFKSRKALRLRSQSSIVGAERAQMSVSLGVYRLSRLLSHATHKESLLYLHGLVDTIWTNTCIRTDKHCRHVGYKLSSVFICALVPDARSPISRNNGIFPDVKLPTF